MRSGIDVRSRGAQSVFQFIPKVFSEVKVSVTRICPLQHWQNHHVFMELAFVKGYCHPEPCLRPLSSIEGKL